MLVFGPLVQVLTIVSTLVWGPEFGSSASCKNICVPVTSWLMWGRRREIQGSSWLVRYWNQNGESVLQRENYRRNKVGRQAGQSWERDTCCEFELAPYLPGGMKEQTFTSYTLISTSTLCHVHMCSCVLQIHTHTYTIYAVINTHAIWICCTACQTLHTWFSRPPILFTTLSQSQIKENSLTLRQPCISDTTESQPSIHLQSPLTVQRPWWPFLF